jgi:GNAT superfamily N-acetyltransferase
VSSTPRFQVRPAGEADVPALARLLGAYLPETYDAPWHGSAEALRRDVLEGRCRMHVAVAADGRVIGFLAWIPSYDLHHCTSGGEGIDLYVVPEARGRGVAPALLCAVAREIERGGGKYLKGGPAAYGSAGRLYRRFAVCHPSEECYVSGRALRRLAELAGRSTRELLRSLPDRSWNYEA